MTCRGTGGKFFYYTLRETQDFLDGGHSDHKAICFIRNCVYTKTDISHIHILTFDDVSAGHIMTQ